MVLEGPNKSMCSSSRGLEVETIFFQFERMYDLLPLLTCFTYAVFLKLEFG